MLKIEIVYDHYSVSINSYIRYSIPKLKLTIKKTLYSFSREIYQGFKLKKISRTCHLRSIVT